MLLLLLYRPLYLNLWLVWVRKGNEPNEKDTKEDGQRRDKTGQWETRSVAPSPQFLRRHRGGLFCFINRCHC